MDISTTGDRTFMGGSDIVSLGASREWCGRVDARQREGRWQLRAIATAEAPAYVPFISQGVISKGLLFASAIPREAGTLHIPPTFREQVNLVLRNLEAVLNGGGCSMSALVKVTVYLADIDDWSVFNEYYRTRVDPDVPPARCAVQIAGLNNGYLIELDVVAEVPGEMAGRS